MTHFLLFHFLFRTYANNVRISSHLRICIASMWPFRDRKRYEAVATDDENVAIVEPQDPQTIQQHRTRRRLLTLGGVFCILLLVALVFVLVLGRGENRQMKKLSDATSNVEEEPHPGPASACGTLSVRREWRTLSRTEQTHYIDSVRCLLTLPSLIHPDAANASRYGDYPYIHSHVGYYTHHSAPFLPWHRYFLHIYESTLRSSCAYTGSLVYWDWTLDAFSLASSPVFSASTGFGGDGEVGGTITVGGSGRCVVDGSFADVVAEYYDTKPYRHCLSRGFRTDDGTLGEMDGSDITAASIEETLRLDDYEAFVMEMESKVHDAIPFGIGGDFETFTAPYDPLFFLHHTQLDRLWWLWQQRDRGKRLVDYGGRNHRHSIEMARLEDEVQMQGFAPSVKVRDVMDTEGGLLCYRY